MRWKLIWLFVVLAFWWQPCSCLRGSELVLQAKAKAAEEKLNPTTEEVVVGEDGNTTTVIKKPLLTGIPQKDYIHDPNLPRELKGHNLTNYPFYNSIPEEIEFACDGLHDGFYASVPHHCQVYHHCLYGTRYDFLCANYTAFDQKTFICHFVSEVDCVNSPKYFVRNEALYKAASTAPPPTTTTAPSTTKATTTTRKPKRRRPGRRRRPIYEYYYDSEEYDDEYYDDEEEEPLPPPRKSGRKQRPHQGSKKEAETTTTPSTTTAAPSGSEPPLTRAPASVYARPRVPPKIKPPVPVNERHKYEYKGPTPGPKDSNNKDDEEDEEYYDDDYEDPPPPQKKKDMGRDKMNRRRPQNSRKRPSRYDEDDYEEEEEDRPRMRKGNRKDEDYRRHRNRKGGYRDDDDDFRDRPARGGSRKRHPEETRMRGERRPTSEYEYYDEEEEEEKYDRRRPTRKPDKRGRTTTKKYEKTTEAAEEEYEEYEDEEEDTKPKKREEVTTLAPHRFSTSAYKTKTTTTRSPPFRRPKPSTDSERRYRPLPKRVETSTEESTTFKRPIVMKATIFPERKFTSLVGTPAGFKKQEEKNTPEPSTEPYKVEEKTEAPRRPFDTYRKQLTNFRRQQEEDKKDENSNRNLPPRREESNYRPPFRMKENMNLQKTDATPTNSGRNSYSADEEPSDIKDNSQMLQEPPVAQSEESISSTKNPIRDENLNFRKYVTRGQDYSSPRSEENVNSNNRYKEESGQNGRIYSPKTQVASNNNEGGLTQTAYKEQAIQNGRIYPSRNQESSSSEGGSSSRYKEENIQNSRLHPSRSQESSSSEAGSSSGHKEETIQSSRLYPSRSQESSSSEGGSSSRYKQENIQNGRIYPSSSEGGLSSRFKEESIQNGRMYPSRNHEASSSEGGLSSRFKEESIQNGRIYPSRNQEASYSEENTSSGYRSPSRNEEQSYRSHLSREEDRQTENPNSQFRNSYSQEERVNNYRNPTAVADDVDYRNPSVSNEEANTNYRPQPSGSGNANYRNPHASSDESQYRPVEENRYRLPNTNDAYQRPEEQWPPKDQTQYLEPSPHPPPLEEDVKPYLTGPGSDQSQEGKSAYPPAVTSPPRGYRRYTKMKVAVRPKPVTEESVEYNKYPLPNESPKVEFTAPGPSAPQATPRPYLDIEEYDVTLNDALQPSTPYSRLKSRGYQPSVTHPSYRTGFLLTAASQTYPTKIAGEYETVVLPAQRFSTKRRPQDWYW